MPEDPEDTDKTSFIEDIFSGYGESFLGKPRFPITDSEGKEIKGGKTEPHYPPLEFGPAAWPQARRDRRLAHRRQGARESWPYPPFTRPASGAMSGEDPDVIRQLLAQIDADASADAASIAAIKERQTGKSYPGREDPSALMSVAGTEAPGEQVVPQEWLKERGAEYQASSGERATADAVAGTKARALDEQDVYEREIQRMLGLPLGPTPGDIEKTYRSVYGVGSDISIIGKSIEDLQAEKVKLEDQDAQIIQAAQGEKFALDALTENEEILKSQISMDLSDDFRDNYKRSKEATASVDAWVKSARDRYENEDPISAFRMFDWFKKEKNEQTGEWEDSFQWSGFATTIASIAAIAGNVGLNMATKGQVPIFMAGMLMKAMDADLDAQKAQARKEGQYGELLNTLITALGNEHDGLVKYREIQFENAELYFKQMKREVQSTDVSKARVLAALEVHTGKKKLEAQMQLAASQKQRALDTAKVEVDRLNRQGAAANRMTVNQMQRLNSLNAAAAVAKKNRDAATPGNWKMTTPEKNALRASGDYLNSIQDIQKEIKAFLKHHGGKVPNGIQQFIATDVAGALGRVGPDSAAQAVWTAFNTKFVSFAQSIARSKDTGNLSKQEQEWWFELGPNPEKQPINIVLAKLANLERSGRIHALNMWSIANNETKNQFRETFSRGFGLESPWLMESLVQEHRKSLQAGGPVFTGMTLEGYPNETMAAIEAALGQPVAQKLQLEPIPGTDLSLRSRVPGAALPIVPTKEIQILDKFRPKKREGEKLSIPGEYVYLPTAEGSEVRLPPDMGNAVAGLQSHIANATGGKVIIMPTGDLSGTRTPEEFAELQREFENYKAREAGKPLKHPKSGFNKHAPEMGGGHAPEGTRKKGKHPAIDFQVGDSPEDPRYQHLVKFGPLFGIYAAHGKEYEGTIHFHHFTYDPTRALRSGTVTSGIAHRVTPYGQTKRVVLDQDRHKAYDRFRELLGGQPGGFSPETDAFLDRVLDEPFVEEAPPVLEIPLKTLPKPRPLPRGPGLIEGQPIASRSLPPQKYRG